MAPKGIKLAIPPPSEMKPRPPIPRQPAFAGVGRLRKIACLGGAKTIKHAPWDDPTWELWSHANSRHMCKREPDLLFDLHPESLWRDPKKKSWDPKYAQWLTTNRIPIMMQHTHKDVPASIKYPFDTMITEFPRGYMTNQVAYMIALALMQGVTHLALFGCEYSSNSEYGPQRGSCEYWLGVAEGRGVRVLLPPGCDLLNKPHLLYGYESHPQGVRHPSYSFSIGPLILNGPVKHDGPTQLIPVSDPHCPPLRDIGVKPEPWSKEIAWA